ncbi:hypothetical protein D3C80_1572340 [compost metagenome]
MTWSRRASFSSMHGSPASGSSDCAAPEMLSRISSTWATTCCAVALLRASSSRSACQNMITRPHSTGTAPTAQGSRARKVQRPGRFTVKGMAANLYWRRRKTAVRLG